MQYSPIFIDSQDFIINSQGYGSDKARNEDELREKIIVNIMNESRKNSYWSNSSNSIFNSIQFYFTY